METETVKKVLPIGTVVNIRLENKMFMIIGYGMNVDNKSYDYSAVVYPYGYEGVEKTHAFNHSAIKKILFKGYIENYEEEVEDNYGDIF